MNRRNWADLSRKLVDRFDLTASMDDIETFVGLNEKDTWGAGVLETTQYPSPLAITMSGVTLGGSVSAGIAYDPIGERMEVGTTQNFSLTADTVNPTKALLVLRYKKTGDTPVPKPSNPILTVFLNLHDDWDLLVLLGTPNISPAYPATQANDVVLMGFTIPPNATLGTSCTQDSSVRMRAAHLADSIQLATTSLAVTDEVRVQEGVEDLDNIIRYAQIGIDNRKHDRGYIVCNGGGVNGDTVSVAGVTFTIGSGSGQIPVQGTAKLLAEKLAVAIRKSSLRTTHIAAAANGRVNVYAIASGAVGGALAETGTTFTVSGAALSGNGPRVVLSETGLLNLLDEIDEKLAAGSGGTSSAGGSDLLRAVIEFEAGQYNVPQGNLIIDDFKQPRGNFTNLGVTPGGQLAFAGASLSGSWNRTLETGTTCTNVAVVGIVRLRALGPKNTTIASNQIIFEGDVTDLFPTSKPVTIWKEVVSDGALRQIELQNNGNFLAKLNVLSATYSSGPDETTVTIDNPQSLDLTMGLSSGQYHDSLRVAPADIDLQAAADGVNLESIPIDEGHIVRKLGFTGINGQQSLLPGSVNGSIDWSDMQASPNKQYMIVSAMERTAGNTLWHFWYSASGGSPGSFVKFALTVTTGTTTQDEMGANWQYANRAQIRVADNGKAVFGIFKENPGTQPSFYAYYSDISLGSPVLAPFPTISADPINDYPAEAGIVFGIASNVASGCTELDSADGSLIAFAGGVSTLFVRFYTWTGAAPVHFGLGTSTITFTPAAARPMLAISGTGPSRVITVVSQRSADGFMQADYWNEGNLTVQGSTVLTSFDCRTIDAVRVNDLFYICLFNNTSPSNISFIRGVLSTQSYSSPHIFHTCSDIDIVTFSQGYGGSYGDIGAGLMRLVRERMVVSPTDNNRVLIAIETLRSSTNYRKAMLYEVTDATNFQGPYITVNNNSSINFRDTVSNQQFAQIITGTAGQKLQSFMTLLRQVGSLPSNAQMYMEIQGVSGGAPDGIVLRTSQVMDASKFSKSGAGTHQYFNFPNLNLLNQQYALVIKANNMPIDGTNFVTFGSNSSSPYTGGNLLAFNGSSWADTTHDVKMEVSGYYVTKISDTQDETTNYWASAAEDQETSISLIDSSSAQILFRRSQGENSVGARAETSGHTYRSVVTFGSGSAPSSFSTPQIVGYKPTDVDKFLVANALFGEAASEGKSITTGLGDGVKVYDRSGNSLSGGYSASPSDFIADSDFDSGFCFRNPGTTSGISMESGGTGVPSIENRPFRIEVEYKANAIAAINEIVNKHLAGNANGFLLRILATGQLSMQNPGGIGGGSTVSNETFAAGTRHLFVVTGDGTTVRMFYKIGPGPGALTEVTYASQSVNYNFVANGYQITFGTVPGSSGEALGRIGRFKWAIGSSTFVYEGFKDQSSLGAMKNVGTRFLAAKRIGHFDDTIGASTSQFNQLQVVDPITNLDPFVDTYESQWLGKKSLNIPGRLLEVGVAMTRGSTRNTMSVDSIGAQWTK